MSAFQDMIARYAQPGRVDAIYLRSERLRPVTAVQKAAIADAGLDGDHGRQGKRAITLMQAEHMPVIASMIGAGQVDPALLRRNLLVSGLNLNALRGRRLAVGGAVLEITGVCAPCSRMETALGSGGYSAMRGHGGWCARVITPGTVAVGDTVAPLADLPQD